MFWYCLLLQQKINISVAVNDDISKNWASSSVILLFLNKIFDILLFYSTNFYVQRIFTSEIPLNILSQLLSPYQRDIRDEPTQQKLKKKTNRKVYIIEKTMLALCRLVCAFSNLPLISLWPSRVLNSQANSLLKDYSLLHCITKLFLDEWNFLSLLFDVTISVDLTSLDKHVSVDLTSLDKHVLIVKVNAPLHFVCFRCSIEYQVYLLHIF